jgi:D-glycero-D-manno-heptose 1,7-bisphosphate phosphatase
MIGDRWRDIDCGAAAGCRSIFIDHGYAEELRAPPDFRASSLLDAAALILSRDDAVGDGGNFRGFSHPSRR